MPLSMEIGAPPGNIRFIPGAPPGVCATLLTLSHGRRETCEECHRAITEEDGQVWFCGATLLQEKRRGGLCFWHYDCLKPAPPSVTLLTDS